MTERIALTVLIDLTDFGPLRTPAGAKAMVEGVLLTRFPDQTPIVLINE